MDRKAAKKARRSQKRQSIRDGYRRPGWNRSHQDRTPEVRPGPEVLATEMDLAALRLMGPMPPMKND